jgi:hypothetical protein
VWSTNLPNQDPSSPAGGSCCSLAVANGVVFATATGAVHALTAANGARLWTAHYSRFSLGGAVSLLSPPSVANGVAYVQDALGKLRAFPAHCGDPCSPVWSSQVDDFMDGFYAAPIVLNGTLYAPGAGLYAFRLPADGGTGRPPATAPSNIAGTAGGCGMIDLTWQDPTAAYPPTAFRITASNGKVTIVQPGGGASLTNVPDGVAVSFTVAAINAAGLGPASSAVGPFTDYCSPGPPTLTAASAGAGSITVTWRPPTSDGGKPITGYLAECSDYSGPESYVHAGPAARAATVQGLVRGRPYQCQVAAQNSEGIGAGSNWSPTLSPT